MTCQMQKLNRRPVSTYNDILVWGAEHLRIYALPTDDLYSFQVIVQDSEDWFKLKVDRVECVRSQWRHNRRWYCKPVEVDRDMEINCIALLNEMGEVVGFKNRRIEVRDGDMLRVDYTFNVEDFDPKEFIVKPAPRPEI